MSRPLARLFVVLIVLIAAGLVALQNRPRAAALDDPALIRVVTFNIQHGEDSDGRYDLNRIAETLAATDADLIGVQEIVRNHVGYHCDDQPEIIAEGLRTRTGQPWKPFYVKEWDTRKTECRDTGRGDEWETEGLALFAPEPFASVEHVRLWNSRIGLMVRLASSPGVPIVVTHLASGASTLNDRVRQIEKLLPWAEMHGPGILMGDLNAEPTAEELAPVWLRYRDAWVEASRLGRATGVRSGSTRTRRESRIDYVLYQPATRLRLESVEVVDTSSVIRRTEASDHRPVIATFRK